MGPQCRPKQIITALSGVPASELFFDGNGVSENRVMPDELGHVPKFADNAIYALMKLGIGIETLNLLRTLIEIPAN